MRNAQLKRHGLKSLVTKKRIDGGTGANRAGRNYASMRVTTRTRFQQGRVEMSGERYLTVMESQVAGLAIHGWRQALMRQALESF